MGFNPRQRRARAISRQLQRLREVGYLTTADTQERTTVGYKEQQGGEARPPSSEAAISTENRATAREPQSSDGTKDRPLTEGKAQHPDDRLPLTPVTRRPPPPPGSEDPRYLLRLRRRTQARYSKAGRVLDYSTARDATRLAYPGNFETRDVLRTPDTRDFVIARFFATMATPNSC